MCLVGPCSGSYSGLMKRFVRNDMCGDYLYGNDLYGIICVGVHNSCDDDRCSEGTSRRYAMIVSTGVDISFEMVCTEETAVRRYDHDVCFVVL